MALSLDLAEQYFTTWLDFLRLRPYAFFAALNQDAKKSLSPLRFVAGSVTVLCAIWAVTFSFYGHLSAESQKAYPQLASSFDAKTSIPQQAFFIVMIFAFSVISIRMIMWWPLRWPGSILDVLRSQAYLLSISVIAAALQGLVTPLIIFIGERTNLPIAMLIGSGILILLIVPFGLYYNLLSLSACLYLRKRRFFEATAILYAMSSLIGGIIGFLIGFLGGRPNTLAQLDHCAYSSRRDRRDDLALFTLGKEPSTTRSH